MLNTFLDPAAARSYFANCLPHFQHGGNSRFDLTLRDVLLRDDWLVVYRLHLSPVAGGVAETRFLVVHRFSDSSFDKAAVRIKKLARAAGKWDAVVPELVHHSPSDKILIYPFPLDTKITYLPDAANPETVRKQFSMAENSLLNRMGSLPECHVEAVRHVPMKRSQLRYTFRDDDGVGVSVYAKTFRRERGRELYHSMLQVAELFGEQGDPLLTAPRPLAYLPRWQMVVQEEAAGRTLAELLQDGDAGEAQMAAAAGAIAVLHNHLLEIETHHEPEDEINLIAASYERLARLGYDEYDIELTLSRIGISRVNCRQPFLSLYIEIFTTNSY